MKNLVQKNPVSPDCGRENVRYHKQALRGSALDRDRWVRRGGRAARGRLRRSRRDPASRGRASCLAPIATFFSNLTIRRFSRRSRKKSRWCHQTVSFEVQTERNAFPIRMIGYIMCFSKKYYSYFSSREFWRQDLCILLTSLPEDGEEQAFFVDR